MVGRLGISTIAIYAPAGDVTADGIRVGMSGCAERAPS